MSKKVIVTIYILLGVLLAGIIAAAAIIIVSSNREHADVLGEMSSKNEALESNGERLTLTVEELEAAKAKLESEVAELNAKLADAGKTFSDEIEALKAEVEAKSAQIADLEADIEKYRTVFNIDVLAQARLIDDIIAYIETECPYVHLRITVTEENEEEFDKKDIETAEDGTKFIIEWARVADLVEEERAKLLPDEMLFTEEELTASGLDEEKLTYNILRQRVFAREDVTYPSVSIYYEDLSTGYHFEYNAAHYYEVASVIKAPYIMSVLETIAKDEEAYLKSLADSGQMPEMIDDDGDGIGDRVKFIYSKPEYDLYEKVVYDSKTMLRDGSGKIKDMPDGTEFSYIDFIKYTLEYSDNVAYGQLRQRFGYDTMIALANKYGVRISGSQMNARGAGKLFKAIYEFIETNETYGKLMGDSMKKANHTVLIPYSVSPDKVMHKYGWDEASYHDAGIVLHSDKPYVLAVFTDLDKGGDEINSYLRGALKMVHKLHKGFYNN